MKNKFILISALSSMALVGASTAALVLSNNGLAFNRVRAGTNDYSVTIDRNSLQYDNFLGHYVSTSKGNMIRFSVNNGELCDCEDPADQALIPSDGLCFLRGNGAGIYFYSPFQNIAYVETVFEFNTVSTSNHLSINFSASSGQFDNQQTFASDASDSGSQIIPAVAEDRYISYWYTCNEDDSLAIIKSIKVVYSCQQNKKSINKKRLASNRQFFTHLCVCKILVYFFRVEISLYYI